MRARMSLSLTLQSHLLHALMEIQFTSQIFKSGKMFVAYTPELDVSTCATTKAKAEKNLKAAVRLFLPEAQRLGTLQQIHQE
jgi:hypothetical protein